MNKKYSEEEYKDLKNHIFDELNKENKFEEFFNPKASPFKYEETIADLYFPSKKFSFEKKYDGIGGCLYCGRSLQFSDAEKNIYEKMKVSLPDACFNCRIQLLSRPYSVVEMEKANCERCRKDVYRGKSSRKFGKIYCEECYINEIY